MKNEGHAAMKQELKVMAHVDVTCLLAGLELHC